jgi:hypothetical protein
MKALGAQAHVENMALPRLAVSNITLKNMMAEEGRSNTGEW